MYSHSFDCETVVYSKYYIKRLTKLHVHATGNINAQLSRTNEVRVYNSDMLDFTVYHQICLEDVSFPSVDGR